MHIFSNNQSITSSKQILIDNSLSNRVLYNLNDFQHSISYTLYQDTSTETNGFTIIIRNDESPTVSEFGITMNALDQDQYGLGLLFTLFNWKKPNPGVCMPIARTHVLDVPDIGNPEQIHKLYLDMVFYTTMNPEYVIIESSLYEIIESYGG